MNLGSPGAPLSPMGHRLPKSALIRSGREIRDVMRRGTRRRTHLLDVFVLDSPELRPRLGFVVPKAGHKIVDRNQLKRRLREIGRTKALPSLFCIERKTDVLIRARRKAYDASWSELEGDLMAAVEGICSENS